MTNYSVFDWLHGYFYGRWVYFYIAVGIGEHSLAQTIGPIATRLINFFQDFRLPGRSKRGGKTDTRKSTIADTYHGKVLSLENAKQLVNVQQPVSLTNLERVIPYSRAKDIILQDPDHIVVLDCPCRMARSQPCTPIDVCLIVGEPFAGFVVEHHPTRARWITAREGIAILEAEHERGHVHHAFFKDAMLGRFYAICNCCGCCCGAMQAHRNGVPMLASSGFVSCVDDAACIGCGVCEEHCQFEAISILDYVAVIDEAQCLGCGVCVDQCDNGALELIANPERGVPLDLNNLMEQATCDRTNAAL
jgi:ferredoxin